MGRIVNNHKQVLIGCAVLLLGVAVYCISRPTWQLPLLPRFPQIYWLPTGVIGAVDNNLPSFIHVFGFSLLSAGIIATRKNMYIVICSLWALINISFEILQSDYFVTGHQQTLVNVQVTGFLLNWLKNYSLNTVFDYCDILAILLGAVSAYWALKQTQQRGEDNG